MVCPHATAVAAGHIEMHSHMRVVVLQRWPDGHSVPVPHEGEPAHELGMSCPHVTVAGLVLGHDGTHSQRPVVVLQRSPKLQRVPVPGQLAPVHTLRMGWPQSNVLAAGHIGMH
jgi:hypothetical protein